MLFFTHTNNTACFNTFGSSAWNIQDVIKAVIAFCCMGIHQSTNNKHLFPLYKENTRLQILKYNS